MAKAGEIFVQFEFTLGSILHRQDRVVSVCILLLVVSRREVLGPAAQRKPVMVMGVRTLVALWVLERALALTTTSKFQVHVRLLLTWVGAIR
jgi:hypothetical protein